MVHGVLGIVADTLATDEVESVSIERVGGVADTLATDEVDSLAIERAELQTLKSSH